MIPEAGPERDRFIAQAVAAGDYEHTWAELGPGLQVSADALRVEGVRVAVSMRLQLELAELLGAELPTAVVCDLRHLAAAVVLEPHPMPISSSTAAMRAHSARIDAAIAAAGGAPSGAIVSSVGKTWILEPDGRACNYGWHVPGPVWRGIRCERAIVGGMWVVQGRGWAHNRDHVDYSQTAIFVRRAN